MTEECAELLRQLAHYRGLTIACSCRFDARITKFATEKFSRDGIDVKTGSMVIKVSEKEISTKDGKTGQTSSIPCGMVLWSTGVATRPVIREFMKQVGQVCISICASVPKSY